MIKKIIRCNFSLTSCLLLGVMLVLCFQVSSAKEVTVIDADTLIIDGNKVRLDGIDAPEINQICLNSLKTEYLCGKRATLNLIALIETSNPNSIECTYTGSDKYGRLIGNCWISGVHINAWLVRNGWALAYRKYNKKFISQEKEAEKLNRGIWEGNFIEPWNWRQGERLANKDEPIANECLIKGNISSSGEKIYHVPGGQYYSRTKISKTKGEKWFCSEQKALEAGWRKSKR